MKARKVKLGTAEALLENVVELARAGSLDVPIGIGYWLQQLQIQIDVIDKRITELEMKVKP